MSNSNKDVNFKEKFKQALNSTFKVISDNLENNEKKEENKGSNKFSFLDLDKLNSKTDFVKARAETDSFALQEKFSNKEIFKKKFTL